MIIFSNILFGVGMEKITDIFIEKSEEIRNDQTKERLNYVSFHIIELVIEKRSL